MPALNGGKDFYEDHILSIRKWQEEKMQSMMRIQEAQRARLEQEKKRMDSIIQQRLNMLTAASKPVSDLHPSADKLRSDPTLPLNENFPLEKAISVNVQSDVAQATKNLMEAKTHAGSSDTAIAGPVTSVLTTASKPFSDHFPFSDKLRCASALPSNEKHSHQEVIPLDVESDAQLDAGKTNKGGIEAKTPAGSSDTSIKEPSMTVTQTFDEIIERQMEKLQLEETDKKISGKPKTKQPFLKKRSGLQKYMGGPVAQKRKQNNKPDAFAKPVPLTLKPAIHKANGIAKDSRVHFDLPTAQNKASIVESLDMQTGPTLINEFGNSSDHKKKSYHNVDAKEIEDKELAEFEILENAAANSSFTDELPISSLFQKKVGQRNKLIDEGNASSSQLLEYVSELEKERKRLAENLGNYKNSDLSIVLDSPVTMAESRNLYANQLGASKSMLGGSILEELGPADSSKSMTSSSCGSSSISSDLNVSVVAACGPDPNILSEQQIVSVKPTNGASYPEVNGIAYNHPEDSERIADTNILNKLEELNKEIDIYKANSAKLESLNKVREQEIETLKKDRIEFEKFKAEEMKKFESEIAEKRKQIRQEKLALERSQKLKKDLPSRKEREEINSLKQQVVSLQEELKKQNIKSSAECRRLKRLLLSAEKERDNLKVENEKLEAKCSEIMGPMNCKQKSAVDLPGTKEHKAIVHQNKVDGETSNEFAESYVEKGNVAISKQQVRFNLEPTVNQKSQENYHEVQYSDRKERIYNDGQLEIHYPTGTVEYISADGSYKKLAFYNGEVKEHFPDKRMIYNFLDGTVLTAYPDGLEVFEYPNGQVETIYPDGTKKVSFPSGHNVVLYPDGAVEEFHPDGTVVKTFSDGMQTLTYPSGDKESRTDDYVKHEYCDGTVQTIYKSGRKETFYANGRLRVKNKDGKVILDIKK